MFGYNHKGSTLAGTLSQSQANHGSWHRIPTLPTLTTYRIIFNPMKSLALQTKRSNATGYVTTQCYQIYYFKKSMKTDKLKSINKQGPTKTPLNVTTMLTYLLFQQIHEK